MLPTDPPVREPDCPVTLWEVQKSKTGLPSCAIFGLLRVHSSIHTCIEPLQYAASCWAEDTKDEVEGGCHSQRPLCLVGEISPFPGMTFPACRGEPDKERVGGGRWAFRVEAWQVWEGSVGRGAGWGWSEGRGAGGHWEGACGERSRGTGCSGRLSSEVGSWRQWLRGNSGATARLGLSSLPSRPRVPAAGWLPPAVVCPACVCYK